MSRNITPRPIKAQGARDSHGHIFEKGAGSLYVHMHREAGLAHRHYVLKPWQVRTLGVLTSRPMIGAYVIAIVSWGWMAGQAARVPLLKREVSTLTADALRLDTLTATLASLQARYDQVQQLLGAANTGASGATMRPNAARAKAPVPDTTSSKGALPDTSRPPTGPR